MTRVHVVLTIALALVPAALRAQAPEAGSVKVTNRTDTQFVITWTTATAVNAKAQIQPAGGTTWEDVVDSRGSGFIGFTHHCRKTAAVVGTTYTFRMVNIDGSMFEDPAYQATTAAALEPNLFTSNKVTGTVADAGGAGIGDAIVYVRLIYGASPSGLMSATTALPSATTPGAWSRFVQLAVAEDASGWFYNSAATSPQVSVDIVAGPAGSFSQTFPITQTPAPGASSITNALGTQTVTTVPVDTTPPATPAAPDLTTDAGSSATDDLTNDATPSLAGTVEADATVKLYKDGVLVGTPASDATGAYTFTSAPLGDGAHAFTLTATDAAGNVSGLSASTTVTVDTAAPTVLNLATSNPTSTSITLDWASSETLPLTNYTIRYAVTEILTETDWDEATPFSATLTGLTATVTGLNAQTTYHFAVRSTDAAGNVSPIAGISGATTATPDTTPPATPAAPDLTTDTGSSGTDNLTADATPDLAGTVEGNAVARLYRNDVLVDTQATGAAGAYAFTSATLADGAHDFKVTATDGAGNVSGASPVTTVTVDTAAPAVLNPATLNPTSTSITLDWASAESVPFAVRMSGSPIVSEADWAAATVVSAALTSPPTTVAGLNPQTTYHFAVRSTDAAGNVSPIAGASGTTLGTPDTTPPAVALTTSSAYGPGSYPGAIEGTSADAATITLRIQDTGTLEYWTGAGWTAASTEVAVAVANAWTYGFSAEDGHSYSLTATAADAAGNSAQAASMFTYDATEPASAVTTTGSLSSLTYGGAITGTASDATSGVASVEVRIQRPTDGQWWNGTAWVAAPAWLAATGQAAWSYPFAPQSGQLYEVSSRARDVVGNVETTPDTQSFSYNVSSPDSAIATSGAYRGATWPGAIAGSAATTDGAAVTLVEVMIREASSDLIFDGTTWTPAPAWIVASGTTAWSLAFAPADRTYVVTARATDSFGNVETTPAESTITYDSIPPDASFTTPPAIDPAAYLGQIQGKASDAGSGLASVTASIRSVATNLWWNGAAWVGAPVELDAAGLENWAVPFAPEAGVTYDVTARVTDAAGNVRTVGQAMTRVAAGREAPTARGKRNSNNPLTSLCSMFAVTQDGSTAAGAALLALAALMLARRR